MYRAVLCNCSLQSASPQTAVLHTRSFVSDRNVQHSWPMTEDPCRVRPWCKVLYEKNPSGDNHVDDTFLTALVKNSHGAPMDLRHLARQSQAITQHVSATVLFLVLFQNMHRGAPGCVTARLLGMLDCMLLLAGHAVVRYCEQLEQRSCRYVGNSTFSWRFTSSTSIRSPSSSLSLSSSPSLLSSSAATCHGKSSDACCTQAERRSNSVRRRTLTTGSSEELLNSIKNHMLFAALLHVMAPMLRTLTKSYANDSIWALTFALTAVHLATHDYRFIIAPPRADGRREKQRGTFSFNAAIFLTVLLASRLRSNDEVVTFIAFSIEVFAYFPIACHHIKHVSSSLYLNVTLFLVIITMVVVFPISFMLGVGYTMTICSLSFFGPWAMIRCQKYKNTMQGPWDVAHVPQQS